MANIRRPRTVKIGHINFRILYVKEKDWRDEEGDKCGLTFPMQGEIWIRTDDNTLEANLQEITLHEIIHAIYHATSLAHYPKPKDGDLEEYTVAMLSGPLLAVLQDNPKTMAYLTQRL